ncbi:AAA family ATPase [Mesorhizobium sp. LNHC221B00]|uniref:AAA family ATPase n=1 Tax=Mesorhizobium sp. LNHC221B00 TaxID=1287233 RepID=UPI0004CF9826|nr:AAA family ATPase [Mesorhizobium sp. LNHC221B00]
MKIESIEIIGLFDRDRRVFCEFNGNLNILTGRNGAGKTTILKLIWYIMSGNILIALSEVEFQRATLKTEEYECTVHRINRATCKIDLTVDGVTTHYEDIIDEDDITYRNAEDEVNPILAQRGSSVFFPTFRRIEGGFTLNTTRAPAPSARPARTRNDVEEALVSLARKLTNDPHVFVSSISTVDIVGLLLRQYADLSEISNRNQQKTSQEIIETIKTFKSDKDDVLQIDTANSIIDQIRQKIEKMEENREVIMNPIAAVRSLVERLFKSTGINFGPRLSFGDAASAVNSDALSAGEKQMLSFICYNAFYKNSAIFIDEPELSLHVDWQRLLFTILEQQQSSNQFIIATHSPFIYSKYPDREININPDRGDRGL